MFSNKKKSTFLVVLVCSITSCIAFDLSLPNADSDRNSDHGRIVGGTNAFIGQHPYQGLLEIAEISTGSSYTCGCVLIRSNWALSAAHCTFGRTASDLTAVFGSIYLNDNGNDPTRRKATATLLYNHETLLLGLVIIDFFGRTSPVTPNAIRNGELKFLSSDYNDRTLKNDISLFQLRSFLILSSVVATISLPEIGDSLTGINEASCVISGWGTTEENGQVSPVLQRATVPLINNSQCDSSVTISTITNTQICAGFSGGGVDSCQGDSGGPLACTSSVDNSWVIIGITSFGVGCARPNNPGVYTRVSSFVTWINETIDGSPVLPIASGCQSVQWNSFLIFIIGVVLLTGIKIYLF